MKKIISFKALSDQYQLVSDEKVVLSIPKNNLTIDGKMLFNNFVSELDLSSAVEFDYVQDLTITDSNEKRIIADIMSILNSIAIKINDKFKLLKADSDSSTEEALENTDKSKD
jgi:predicted thioredoxin/glutaredoxin